MSKVRLSLGPKLEYPSVPAVFIEQKGKLWPPFSYKKVEHATKCSASMQPVFLVESDFARQFVGFMEPLQKPRSLLLLPCDPNEEITLSGLHKGHMIYDVKIRFVSFSTVKLTSFFPFPDSGIATYSVDFEAQ